MDKAEQFLQNNNLQDPDDFEALLEMASLVRTLIADRQYADINRIIFYTLEQSCYEVFSWCMEILQEDLERESCEIESFDCMLGRSVPNFDAFAEVLQVDFKASSNDIETVLDRHGEAESFFNILVYKTKYTNIYLVSSENFDTKDNDFVQYKLSFVRR